MRDPMPVRVTTPMMIPTQAAAAMSDTPAEAVRLQMARRSGAPIRVSGCRAACISTNSRLNETARKGVKPTTRNRIREANAVAHRNPAGFESGTSDCTAVASGSSVCCRCTISSSEV